MLPDNMFLNLIDMDLQQKIVMTDDLDGSAAEALKHSFLQRKELYTKKYGLMMRNSEKLS